MILVLPLFRIQLKDVSRLGLVANIFIFIDAIRGCFAFEALLLELCIARIFLCECSAFQHSLCVCNVGWPGCIEVGKPGSWKFGKKKRAAREGKGQKMSV